MSLLGRLFSGKKKTPEERMIDATRRMKKTPEEKARMMDSLAIARFKICKIVYEKLPEHLRSNEPTQLNRAIAEQINYATASSDGFEGDDEEMRRKLEALVTELRLKGADQAASEIISAVEMRPNYLAFAESIMH